MKIPVYRYRSTRNNVFLLLLTLGLLAPTHVFAQGKAKAKSKAKTSATTSKKNVIQRTVAGKATGWPINFTYYSSSNGKETPVLMLLHDKAGNQVIWEKSAELLQKKGYAVITVDFRKHGKSIHEGAGQPKKLVARDYQLMALEDLEVVKNFLMQEHHEQKLNIRKLGIVAMGMSAPIALNFAANDWNKRPHSDGATLASRTPKGQDVRAMAFISPESSVSGVTTTKPLRFLQSPALNVAMIFVAGVADKGVKRTVEKMYKQVSTNPKNKKRMHMVSRKDKANGKLLLSDRFRKPTTELLVKFFDDNLKSLEGSWRNRKSKLTN